MNYTINVSLPKGLVDLAKAQVKLGYYSSVSEVLRASLREHLMFKSDFPTFVMSAKTEKRGLEALQDHLEGKTILLEDIEDLGKLS